MRVEKSEAVEATETTSKNVGGVKAWEEMTERERDGWVAEHACGWQWLTHDPLWVVGPYKPHRRLYPPAALSNVRLIKAEDCPLAADWYYGVPAYTSDDAADNEVRKAMRGKGSITVEKFYDALLRVLHERWTASDEFKTMDLDTTLLYAMNFYEVGDYSHAAYLTLSARATEGETK
jgi:hypothetical protein